MFPDNQGKVFRGLYEKYSSHFPVFVIVLLQFIEVWTDAQLS